MRADTDPHGSPSAPARRSPDSAASRALAQRAFELRSIALEVLETHGAHMRRPRALLERARAVCSAIGITLPAATWAPRPPAERAPSTAPRCAISGCPRPPPFQPLFVVDSYDRRVVVRDLPLRVCAEHRADIDAVFRRPAVLQALRRKLLARGRRPPGAVMVLFEAVD